MKSFNLFEIVALQHDVPDEELRVGDAGTIVELLDDRGVIVEFMEASGNTRAVLTLATSHIRKVRPREMLAVRRS